MRGKGGLSGSLIAFLCIIGVSLVLLEKLYFIIVPIILIVGIVGIIIGVRGEVNKVVVDLSEIDTMDGLEFEKYIAKLLSKNGFSGIKITPASGDYGVDILASKEGEKYAIQCKRYAKNVGVKPVQEVYAGSAMYGAARCAVITNMYFSDNGKILAKKLGVILWDRDQLQRMMKNADK